MLPRGYDEYRNEPACDGSADQGKPSELPRLTDETPGWTLADRAAYRARLDEIEGRS